MTEFSAQVFQNEFLADGATDVHAIVTMTCTGAGQAGQSDGGDAAEVIIVDTSGSMGLGIEQARTAASAAINEILDGTWFAVIAGNHLARVAFPQGPGEVGMIRMDASSRARAHAAIKAFIADGGTAMGTWLTKACEVFASVSGVTQRHAILLTDGKNQHETPEQLTLAIEAASGKFQCDCRGVGVAWEVEEVRRIAKALMGSIDIIPTPQQMAAEFERLMQAAMSRGVASADLRVWAPQGAQVLFVRQVAPSVEDLTGRRREVNALTSAFPTGSWGNEVREFHVAVRLPAGKGIGQEQLAARVQLALGEDVQAQALVKAKWSDDEGLTAQINPEVAHYTGQTELAEAIQDGLAAKAAGDAAGATAKLGRAVQLAAQTGNVEATAKLRKVVEIDEAGTGKVRLRASVDKVDEMALDTASTKTTRVHR